MEKYVNVSEKGDKNYGLEIGESRSYTYAYIIFEICMRSVYIKLKRNYKFAYSTMMLGT
ncbi:MAG: hypothetical protein IJE43_03040 [Alphaproteobacteria bacterium]|nr:hypothetical protein [Alphaproteobacteria bacterium]MBQ6886259.1 hypothetical protein [Lachnospiraceae bacterium]